MSTIRSIRQRLGVTQSCLAEALEVSQSNVSFYERGQTVPPVVAARLIRFAATRDVALTYEDIYGDAQQAAGDARKVA